MVWTVYLPGALLKVAFCSFFVLFPASHPRSPQQSSQSSILCFKMFATLLCQRIAVSSIMQEGTQRSIYVPLSKPRSTSWQLQNIWLDGRLRTCSESESTWYVCVLQKRLWISLVNKKGWSLKVICLQTFWLRCIPTNPRKALQTFFADKLTFHSRMAQNEIFGLQ